VGLLLGIDATLRRWFLKKGLSQFPSSLAGMLGLLAVFLATSSSAASRAKAGPPLYRLLKPGSDLLTRWVDGGMIGRGGDGM
jgi:hypothetical protein